jgi:hypothetical protein
VDVLDFEDWFRGEYQRVYASVLVVRGDRGLASLLRFRNEGGFLVLERWVRCASWGRPGARSCSTV